jgi:Eco57I restriction-modification methylase
VSEFSSLKIVGGLLSSDLLGRVFSGDTQVPGTSPESYGLERGESVRRQASRSWPYLLETWQDEKKRDSRFIRILLRELGFPHQMPEHIAFRGVGWDVSLDHKTPNREARAPHSVMQELLNRDDTRLWGLLSNGTTLRLLRDSATLISQSYVEFDLRAIFDGELFSDFVLLYVTCHESRFATQGDGGPETCYLEQWRTASANQGERVLDQLRKGVEQAISILGTGFIAHPSNPHLRAQLEKNELRLDDLNRALLRVVYRMLFWFVAEDRDALLIPVASDTPGERQTELREARERYAAYFSANRLRHLARRHRGTRHTDLFDALGLVFDALGTEGGVPQLALPGIGGIFETGALDEPLSGARLTNESLLSAVRALAWFKSREGGPLRRVDFGNLGAEELGSIYESLLELIPYYDPDQRSYTLTVLPGNERKESGSYYTPTSLVECLLDSALDPLLDEATARGTSDEKIAALLDLTVCDPACGSGHFLVAAARRMAKRIAAEETGESEPPETVIRRALRRVVGRCIYGVDINPMSVELAKISLWMEALEPGKPLSYLDQNIRVGNSLLGVTPALLANGLPDTAFTPIEGDDRKVVAALKKQNAAERLGQHDLFSQSGIPVSNAILAKRADTIVHTLPDSLEDLHVHQQRQAEQLVSSAERRIQKLLADAWCAAFVQPKTDITRSTAITHQVIENFAADESSLNLAAAEQQVADLTRQYRFFHWHIEFPHIFRVGNGARDLDPKTSWSGGFSCVVGNPPWERVKLQEQEFFASRNPEIATASNAAFRKKLIAALPDTDQALYDEFQAELRKASGWSYFLRESGRYPLTGRGDVNTYAVFAETARTVIGPRGRSGLVLPTGIATDATTAPFFADLVSRKSIVSVYDFENEEKIFQDVNNRPRFCLLVVAGRSSLIHEIQLAFRARQVRYLDVKRFTISPQEIARINPNTLTCPVFDSPRNAQIVIGIYNRVPVLWNEDPDENPWGLSFLRMFDMANDADLFHVTNAGDVLPLYEAKMIHHFDHRFATYEGATQAQINKGTLPRFTAEDHENPSRVPMPRYWVEKSEVDKRIVRRGWKHNWLIGWRDIARTTDERAMICSVLPRTATPDGTLLMLPAQDTADALLANLSSFALDYVVRQKNSGAHLKYFTVKQLPVLPPSAYRNWSTWIRPRVLELTYTAWDMAPFARDLGDNGPPFRWDEDRRFLMRAELDAAFFHLYGIDRDDVDYIMETFPIVKRKDIAAHGTYRTKDKILEIYDAMAKAKSTGTDYKPQLSPPPGRGTRHRARDLCRFVREIGSCLGIPLPMTLFILPAFAASYICREGGDGESWIAFTEFPVPVTG